MSTAPNPATAAMFDPDGQIRQVPQDQFATALQNGGRYAVRMRDPQGVVRYIPHDKVLDARRAGGQVDTSEPAVSQPGFLTQLGHGLTSLLGMIPNVAPGAGDIVSQVAGTGATMAEAFEKARAENEAARTAEAAGRHGQAAVHTLGAAGYGASGLLAPVGGGAMMQAGEHLTQPGHRLEGAIETGGLLAPVAAAHMLPETARTSAAPEGFIEKGATHPKHIEALTGLVSDRNGAVNPHETATTALPVARETASRLKIDPGQFKGRRGGELVTGKDGVFHKAIQEKQAEYDALKQPVADQHLDTTPIAKAYLDKITPELQRNEPQVANKLRAEADKWAHVNDQGEITAPKPDTLQNIDQFRVRQNKELHTFEQKAVGQQIMSDIEIRAAKAANDAARELIYQTVGKASGRGEAYVRNLQAEQGALVEAKNNLQQEFNRASGEQGEAVTKGVREKVAKTYPSPRGVRHMGIKELIGPKPLDIFNQRLKKMFADLPEAQQPQQPTGVASAANRPPIDRRAASREPLHQQNYTEILQRQRAELRQAQASGDTEHAAYLQRAIQQTQTLAKERGAKASPKGPSGATRLPAPSPTIPGNRVQPPVEASPTVSRGQRATLLMLAAKRGEISPEDADRQIQKLVGSGGRRTIRRPISP